MAKAEFWEAVLTGPESFWPHLDELALKLRPGLIVVDSVTPLIEGPEGRRYLLNTLYRTIKPLGSDVVLIAEADGPSFVEYIADNVIRMELELTEYAVPERRLCVVKARGMPGGYCKQFGIFGGAGLLTFDELKPPSRPHVEVKTGLAIEDLLGGPLVGNTLILGPLARARRALP
ncbi:MAG: RAD55 family ATPase [Thermoproteus sp. AZ2]|uniref:RAD55 family ATPase n=1 Tax=Thermoproteus sp. AZ2 TaxID=1609232 RepID=A0ACC6UXZ4_9CREN